MSKLKTHTGRPNC